MLSSIKKKQIIKSIFGCGKVFDTTLFKFYYIFSDCKDIKYALSVSKKLGIAVKRNRAKRIVRAVLRDSFKLHVSMIVRFKKINFTYYEAAKEFFLFQNYISNQELTNSNDKTL